MSDYAEVKSTPVLENIKWIRIMPSFTFSLTIKSYNKNDFTDDFSDGFFGYYNRDENNYFVKTADENNVYMASKGLNTLYIAPNQKVVIAFPYSNIMFVHFSKNDLFYENGDKFSHMIKNLSDNITIKPDSRPRLIEFSFIRYYADSRLNVFLYNLPSKYIYIKTNKSVDLYNPMTIHCGTLTSKMSRFRVRTRDLYDSERTKEYTFDYLIHEINPWILIEKSNEENLTIIKERDDLPRSLVISDINESSDIIYTTDLLYHVKPSKNYNFDLEANQQVLVMQDSFGLNNKSMFVFLTNEKFYNEKGEELPQYFEMTTDAVFIQAPNKKVTLSFMIQNITNLENYLIFTYPSEKNIMINSKIINYPATISIFIPKEDETLYDISGPISDKKSITEYDYKRIEVHLKRYDYIKILGKSNTNDRMSLLITNITSDIFEEEKPNGIYLVYYSSLGYNKIEIPDNELVLIHPPLGCEKYDLILLPSNSFVDDKGLTIPEKSENRMSSFYVKGNSNSRSFTFAIIDKSYIDYTLFIFNFDKSYFFDEQVAEINKTYSITYINTAPNTQPHIFDYGIKDSFETYSYENNGVSTEIFNFTLTEKNFFIIQLRQSFDRSRYSSHYSISNINNNKIYLDVTKININANANMEKQEIRLNNEANTLIHLIGET